MFCPKCGKENADDSQFCTSCGAALNPTPASANQQTEAPAPQQQTPAPTLPPQPQPVQPPPGIVCPQCGSRHLTVLSETNVQTTGKNFSLGQACCGDILLGPFGLLCGLCGQGKTTTSTSTTYWVCSNCGKKFLHFDEYEKRIKNSGLISKITLILGIINFPLISLIAPLIMIIATFLSAGGGIEDIGYIISNGMLGDLISGIVLLALPCLPIAAIFYACFYVLKKRVKKDIAERDELKAQMQKFLQQ